MLVVVVSTNEKLCNIIITNDTLVCAFSGKATFVLIVMSTTSLLISHQFGSNSVIVASSVQSYFLKREPSANI